MESRSDPRQTERAIRLFQFGHGGEPWSHAPQPNSIFEATEFQFGHGGEPWSHVAICRDDNSAVLGFNSATAVSRGVT